MYPRRYTTVVNAAVGSRCFFARFGEDDATLLLEEKMWARMQKDRNQRGRSGGIFNLGDESGRSEVLTHRGQALSNNCADNDEPGDQGDDLSADVVDKLHFGGGGDGGGGLRLVHSQVPVQYGDGVQRHVVKHSMCDCTPSECNVMAGVANYRGTTGVSIIVKPYY